MRVQTVCFKKRYSFSLSRFSRSDAFVAFVDCLLLVVIGCKQKVQRLYQMVHSTSAPHIRQWKWFRCRNGTNIRSFTLSLFSPVCLAARMLASAGLCAMSFSFQHPMEFITCNRNRIYYIWMEERMWTCIFIRTWVSVMAKTFHENWAKVDSRKTRKKARRQQQRRRRSENIKFSHCFACNWKRSPFFSLDDAVTFNNGRLTHMIRIHDDDKIQSDGFNNDENDGKKIKLKRQRHCSTADLTETGVPTKGGNSKKSKRKIANFEATLFYAKRR